VEEYIEHQYIPLEMGGECDYIYNPDEFKDDDIAVASEEAVPTKSA